MAPALIVEPFDAAAYARWRDHTIAAYAAEKVQVGTWAEDVALTRSRASFDALLPQDAATAGHELGRVLTAATSELVGWFWVGPATDAPPDLGWLFDIEVVPGHRGQGHGHRILSLAEQAARQLGYTRLGLHVFAPNRIARTLYESAGYTLTDLSYAKSL